MYNLCVSIIRFKQFDKLLMSCNFREDLRLFDKFSLVALRPGSTNIFHPWKNRAEYTA